MAKRLYVGNLDYSTTEAELAQVFGEIGEVVSVNLITDQATGRSRGFAFVEMASDSAAEEAIEDLNGKVLGARAITVAEARPRRDAGGSRGGGGRGGGRGGEGGDRRRRY
jgi:RNA recognition motif-containing protein